MPTSYPLLRCGESINVERESDFFTTIIPDKLLLPNLERIPEVQQVKQVLDNVYKVKSVNGERDGLMKYLRKQLPEGSVVHHAYHPEGDPVTRYYITDRIIICFAAETSMTTVEDIIAKHKLALIRQYDVEKMTFLVQVTSAAGKNPLKVSLDLQEEKAVTFAEPNLINRYQEAYQPSDSLYELQWHLRSWDGWDLAPGADVDAPNAWEISRGSRSVTVAVIDDGFDLSHPDLSGPGKVPFQIDFVDDDNLPLPTRANNDYHGTPCAGVAIGEENGQGIVGVAPGCSFLPVRFPLAADDNLLWEIFEYTGQRADILSCSWGPVPVYAPLNQLIYDQFSRLTRSGSPSGKGCVIMFAAGNYNAPLKDLSNTFFRWKDSRGIVINRRAILNGHAAHPDVIAVAASTSLNKKAWYSNWGPEISICAPSNNFHPLDGNIEAPGRGIWTTDNEEFGLGFSNNNRYTGKFGGTSSATPLAAGVAALVRSVNPDLSAREIREVLEQSTDKIIDTDADPVLEQRKGQYDASGHSEWFGFGKINAAKALVLAGGSIPVPPEPTPEPEPEPEPPVEEPEVPVVVPPTAALAGSVAIMAAMVNPAGRETGNEQILLFNRSNALVDLSNWSISDDKGRTDQLGDMSISSGVSITLTLKKVKLTNSGGTISLKDASDTLIHELVYTKADASQEGWWVV